MLINEIVPAVMGSQKRLCYFYVVIPPEDTSNSGDVSQTVSTSTELNALMKKNPNARFHSGSSMEEAVQKATTATTKIHMSQDTDSIPSPTSNATSSTTTGRRKGRQSFSAVESSIGAPAVASPKTGELLMTGRDILAKRNEKVFETIEANPRILCTDSEFPTILQEGCKYNALHLAARCNNGEVMRKILSLTSSMDFMRRIYPTQTEEILRAGCTHLVSCYLNTPDKMFQETPLHFACKHNSAECVELLLNHPFCKTHLLNYERMTPFQLIGTRDQPKGPKADAIKQMFSRRFIVPIWRDLVMEGDPPILGDVCYIPNLGQAIPEPLLLEKFPDFSMSLLDPCSENLLPKNNTVKVFVNQPSTWKIQAYAGPMDETSAKDFRRVMKCRRNYLSGFASPDVSLNNSENIPNEEYKTTPPCTPKKSTIASVSTPPHSNRHLLSPIRSPLSTRSFCDSPIFNSPARTDIAARVKDVEKGLERVAFEYCQQANIPWMEYWKFLGTFCNLSSESGLELLEAHLKVLEAEKITADDDSQNTGVSECSNSRSSNALDDLINKLQRVRLNTSGIPSPEGRVGYCNNPLCRQESRFCNCDTVVPKIPYKVGDVDDEEKWIYGNAEVIFDGLNEIPFGIRNLETSFNTDSFEVSDTSLHEREFEWPGPPALDLFATAPSSPAEMLENEDDADVFEDCSSSPVYLSRNKEPGKLDYQIFQILKDCSELIDDEKYIAVFQWFNSMLAHGNKLLKGIRRTDISCTPRRLWEPSFVSTPTKNIRDCDPDSF